MSVEETKKLKEALGGVPAPQHFDSTKDDYDYSHGRWNALKVVPVRGSDGDEVDPATEETLTQVRTATTTVGSKIDTLRGAVLDVETKVEALTAIIEGTDFGTETKLEAIRLILSSTDFATDTRLQAIHTLLGATDFATDAKLEAIRAILAGVDFATGAKQDALKAELEAVKAELQAMKANQLSGDQKVQLSGTLPALNAVDPATGTPVPVQAVQDDAGNWVLGIVDRAPYAYDPVADATRVVLPTLVSGVYTRTNALVSASSSWSTDIIESGEAQRIRLTTFSSHLFTPEFVDLSLEWYADADGQWMIVREVTGEPAHREIKFENIKPIRGNAGIGIATVKGPYFRFTFFNTHESASYFLNHLAIHKFLDG